MRSDLVKTLLGTAVVCALMTPNAGAVEPTATDVAKPQSVPTTQPVPANIAALIKQLGDETYARRQEAAVELKKMGKAALPALTQASNDDNPQIRTSAQAMVTQIRGENKNKTLPNRDDGSGGFGGMPGVVRLQGGGNVQIHNLQIGGNGVAHMQVQMIVNGQSTRDTTVDQNGRKIDIHEDADGIKMEITEKGETKELKAKDADDLKKNHPEEFKLYEQFSGKGNGAIRMEPILPRE